MPVFNPGANAFRVMNYGEAVQTGQDIAYNRLRNEAQGMEIKEAQNMLANREKAQEIRMQQEKTPDQIAKLEESGLFREADELRNSYISARKAEVEFIESMRPGINASNFKAIKQAAIAEGTLMPGMWPDEYSDDWFRKERDTKAGALSRFTRRSLQNGAVMSQDIVSQDGNILWEGDWFQDPDDVPKPGTDAESDDATWKPKASDSNTIAKAVNEYFDTRYDPQTQEFKLMSKDEAQRAGAIKSEAERIYSANKGRLSHGQAVTQAARKFNIVIEDKEQTETTDPLGFGDKLRRPAAATRG